MEKNNTYHIFISYRRKCSDKTARILQLALEKAGYDVFLDYDALNNNSTFTERIRKAIENSPIFILLLAPNAFDRCNEEKDIMRMEIEYAIATERTIIPVNFDKSFKDFPDSFPIELKNKISSHNYAEIIDGQTFNYTISGFIKDRIFPIVGYGKKDKYRDEEGANVYITSDVDCRAYRYGKEWCNIQRGEYKHMKLQKGEHQLVFISNENTEDKFVIEKYVVNSNDESLEIKISFLKIIKKREINKKKRYLASVIGGLCNKIKCFFSIRKILLLVLFGIVIIFSLNYVDILFYAYKVTKSTSEKAIHWYTKAAEQGNSDAQFYLGVCYDEALGVNKDEEKAFYWWTESAKKYNKNACFRLGVCYHLGYGYKEEDPELAFILYRMAAKQGHPIAEYNLGVCYADGFGVDKDSIKAIYWYERSAKHGYVNALNNLGHCYLFGYGVSEKNEKKAVSLFKQAAKQGSSHAYFNLGYCYLNGYGVSPSTKDAVYWFVKSAEDGYFNAQHALGLGYYNGWFENEDEEKAVYWWEKASEQGYGPSLYKLGVCYYHGFGIDENKEQAIYCWEQAAEQGEIDAYNKLGYCYYYGIREGGDNDIEKAVYWWEKAARQGHPEAQFRLGVVYAESQNWKEAVYWYTKAAEQGDPDAQYNLWHYYEEGKDGEPIDYDKAVYWHNKYDEQGEVLRANKRFSKEYS